MRPDWDRDHRIALMMRKSEFKPMKSHPTWCTHCTRPSKCPCKCNITKRLFLSQQCTYPQFCRCIQTIEGPGYVIPKSLRYRKHEHHLKKKSRSRSLEPGRVSRSAEIAVKLYRSASTKQGRTQSATRSPYKDSVTHKWEETRQTKSDKGVRRGKGPQRRALSIVTSPDMDQPSPELPTMERGSDLKSVVDSADADGVTRKPDDDTGDDRRESNLLELEEMVDKYNESDEFGVSGKGSKLLRINESRDSEKTSQDNNGDGSKDLLSGKQESKAKIRPVGKTSSTITRSKASRESAIKFGSRTDSRRSSVDNKRSAEDRSKKSSRDIVSKASADTSERKSTRSDTNKKIVEKVMTTEEVSSVRDNSKAIGDDEEVTNVPSVNSREDFGGKNRGDFKATTGDSRRGSAITQEEIGEFVISGITKLTKMNEDMKDINANIKEDNEATKEHIKKKRAAKRKRENDRKGIRRGDNKSKNNMLVRDFDVALTPHKKQKLVDNPDESSKVTESKDKRKSKKSKKRKSLKEADSLGEHKNTEVVIQVNVDSEIDEPKTLREDQFSEKDTTKLKLDQLPITKEHSNEIYTGVEDTYSEPISEGSSSGRRSTATLFDIENLEYGDDSPGKRSPRSGSIRNKRGIDKKQLDFQKTLDKAADEFQLPVDNEDVKSKKSGSIIPADDKQQYVSDVDKDVISPDKKPSFEMEEKGDTKMERKENAKGKKDKKLKLSKDKKDTEAKETEDGIKTVGGMQQNITGIDIDKEDLSALRRKNKTDKIQKSSKQQKSTEERDREDVVGKVGAESEIESQSAVKRQPIEEKDRMSKKSTSIKSKETDDRHKTDGDKQKRMDDIDTEDQAISSGKSKKDKKRKSSKKRESTGDHKASEVVTVNTEGPTHSQQPRKGQPVEEDRTSRKSVSMKSKDTDDVVEKDDERLNRVNMDIEDGDIAPGKSTKDKERKSSKQRESIGERKSSEVAITSERAIESQSPNNGRSVEAEEDRSKKSASIKSKDDGLKTDRESQERVNDMKIEDQAISSGKSTKDKERKTSKQRESIGDHKSSEVEINAESAIGFRPNSKRQPAEMEDQISKKSMSIKSKDTDDGIKADGDRQTRLDEMDKDQVISSGKSKTDKKRKSSKQRESTSEHKASEGVPKVNTESVMNSQQPGKRQAVEEEDRISQKSLSIKSKDTDDGLKKDGDRQKHVDDMGIEDQVIASGKSTKDKDRKSSKQRESIGERKSSQVAITSERAIESQSPNKGRSVEAEEDRSKKSASIKSKDDELKTYRERQERVDDMKIEDQVKSTTDKERKTSKQRECIGQRKSSEVITAENTIASQSPAKGQSVEEIDRISKKSMSIKSKDSDGGLKKDDERQKRVDGIDTEAQVNSSGESKTDKKLKSSKQRDSSSEHKASEVATKVNTESVIDSQQPGKRQPVEEEDRISQKSLSIKSKDIDDGLKKDGDRQKHVDDMGIEDQVITQGSGKSTKDKDRKSSKQRESIGERKSSEVVITAENAFASQSPAKGQSVEEIDRISKKSMSIKSKDTDDELKKDGERQKRVDGMDTKAQVNSSGESKSDDQRKSSKQRDSTSEHKVSEVATKVNTESVMDSQQPGTRQLVEEEDGMSKKSVSIKSKDTADGIKKDYESQKRVDVMNLEDRVISSDKSTTHKERKSSKQRESIGERKACEDGVNAESAIDSQPASKEQPVEVEEHMPKKSMSIKSKDTDDGIIVDGDRQTRLNDMDIEDQIISSGKSKKDQERKSSKQRESIGEQKFSEGMSKVNVESAIDSQSPRKRKPDDKVERMSKKSVSITSKDIDDGIKMDGERHQSLNDTDISSGKSIKDEERKSKQRESVGEHKSFEFASKVNVESVIDSQPSGIGQSVEEAERTSRKSVSVKAEDTDEGIKVDGKRQKSLQDIEISSGKIGEERKSSKHPETSEVLGKVNAERSIDYQPPGKGYPSETEDGMSKRSMSIKSGETDDGIKLGDNIQQNVYDTSIIDAIIAATGARPEQERRSSKRPESVQKQKSSEVVSPVNDKSAIVFQPTSKGQTVETEDGLSKKSMSIKSGETGDGIKHGDNNEGNVYDTSIIDAIIAATGARPEQERSSKQPESIQKQKSSKVVSEVNDKSAIVFQPPGQNVEYEERISKKSMSIKSKDTEDGIKMDGDIHRIVNDLDMQDTIISTGTRTEDKGRKLAMEPESIGQYKYVTIASKVDAEREMKFQQSENYQTDDEERMPGKTSSLKPKDTDSRIVNEGDKQLSAKNIDEQGDSSSKKPRSQKDAKYDTIYQKALDDTNTIPATIQDQTGKDDISFTQRTMFVGEDTISKKSASIKSKEIGDGIGIDSEKQQNINEIRKDVLSDKKPVLETLTKDDMINSAVSREMVIQWRAENDGQYIERTKVATNELGGLSRRSSGVKSNETDDRRGIVGDKQQYVNDIGENVFAKNQGLEIEMEDVTMDPNVVYKTDIQVQRGDHMSAEAKATSPSIDDTKIRGRMYKQTAVSDSRSSKSKRGSSEEISDGIERRRSSIARHMDQSNLTMPERGTVEPVIQHDDVEKMYVEKRNQYDDKSKPEKGELTRSDEITGSRGRISEQKTGRIYREVDAIERRESLRKDRVYMRKTKKAVPPREIGSDFGDDEAADEIEESDSIDESEGEHAGEDGREENGDDDDGDGGEEHDDGGEQSPDGGGDDDAGDDKDDDNEKDKKRDDEDNDDEEEEDEEEEEVEGQEEVKEDEPTKVYDNYLVDSVNQPIPMDMSNVSGTPKHVEFSKRPQAQPIRTAGATAAEIGFSVKQYTFELEMERAKHGTMRSCRCVISHPKCPGVCRRPFRSCFCPRMCRHPCRSTILPTFRNPYLKCHRHRPILRPNRHCNLHGGLIPSLPTPCPLPRCKYCFCEYNMALPRFSGPVISPCAPHRCRCCFVDIDYIGAKPCHRYHPLPYVPPPPLPYVPPPPPPPPRMPCFPTDLRCPFCFGRAHLSETLRCDLMNYTGNYYSSLCDNDTFASSKYKSDRYPCTSDFTSAQFQAELQEIDRINAEQLRAYALRQATAPHHDSCATYPTKASGIVSSKIKSLAGEMSTITPQKGSEDYSTYEIEHQATNTSEDTFARMQQRLVDKSCGGLPEMFDTGTQLNSSEHFFANDRSHYSQSAAAESIVHSNQSTEKQLPSVSHSKKASSRVLSAVQSGEPQSLKDAHTDKSYKSNEVFDPPVISIADDDTQPLQPNNNGNQDMDDALPSESHGAVVVKNRRRSSVTFDKNVDKINIDSSADMGENVLDEDDPQNLNEVMITGEETSPALIDNEDGIKGVGDAALSNKIERIRTVKTYVDERGVTHVKNVEVSSTESRDIFTTTRRVSNASNGDDMTVKTIEIVAKKSPSKESMKRKRKPKSVAMVNKETQATCWEDPLVDACTSTADIVHISTSVSPDKKESSKIDIVVGPDTPPVSQAGDHKPVENISSNVLGDEAHLNMIMETTHKSPAVPGVPGKSPLKEIDVDDDDVVVVSSSHAPSVRSGTHQNMTNVPLIPEDVEGTTPLRDSDENTQSTPQNASKNARNLESENHHDPTADMKGDSKADPKADSKPIPSPSAQLYVETNIVTDKSVASMSKLRDERRKSHDSANITSNQLNNAQFDVLVDTYVEKGKNMLKSGRNRLGRVVVEVAINVEDSQSEEDYDAQASMAKLLEKATGKAPLSEY